MKFYIKDILTDIIYIYVCVRINYMCVYENVKFSSTRPTSRVNLLSLKCELIFNLYICVFTF